MLFLFSFRTLYLRCIKISLFAGELETNINQLLFIYIYMKATRIFLCNIPLFIIFSLGEQVTKDK